MREELEKFNNTLLENISFEMVPLDKLVDDDQLAELIEQCNPFSALRATVTSIKDEPNLCNLLSIQSPIIAYKYRYSYRVISGVFTLTTLRVSAAQNLIKSDHDIPIFLLKKKPNEALKRQVALFDLTSNLLSKSFTSDSKKIGQFLRAWFKKDEKKKSIYQSREWQSLYPSLTTTDRLAAYLCISKKGL